MGLNGFEDMVKDVVLEVGVYFYFVKFKVDIYWDFVIFIVLEDFVGFNGVLVDCGLMLLSDDMW